MHGAIWHNFCTVWSGPRTWWTFLFLLHLFSFFSRLLDEVSRLRILSRTHFLFSCKTPQFNMLARKMFHLALEMCFHFLWTCWFIICYKDEVGNTKRNSLSSRACRAPDPPLPFPRAICLFAAIALKMECSALKTGPLWQPDKWRQYHV